MKHRLLVALVPGPDLALRVRTIRDLFREPRRETIVPHLTLVSPVNVAESDLPQAISTVRRVAADAAPFSLTLGPLATFAPATPTLHLAVIDESGSTAAIRAQLSEGPFDRPERWPFTPHVTVLQTASEAQRNTGLSLTRMRGDSAQSTDHGSGSLSSALDTASTLLVGGSWEVDRLYLMEQITTEEGHTWTVLCEERFGGSTVVGRGGVELQLRAVGHLEPRTVDLLTSLHADPGDDSPQYRPQGSVAERSLLVVTAEMPGASGDPVGAAVGSASAGGAWLDALGTAESFRDMGVARHVMAHWCFQAARRGARIACAEASPEDQVLEHLGFSRVGGLLVRQLS